MTAPSNAFSRGHDEPEHVVVQRPVSKERTSAFRPRYLALWTGSGGQLSFGMYTVWADCMDAIQQSQGLSGWSLHAGPSELIWEIRTTVPTAGLRTLIELAIADRVPWVLLDPDGWRLSQRKWPDDPSILQIALANWERRDYKP